MKVLIRFVKILSIKVLEMYKIKEIAKLFNISSELLRYYERFGLINPRREEKGYRYYNLEHVKLLTGILRFRKMNFTLAETKKLLYEADYEACLKAYEDAKARTEFEIIRQKAILENTNYIIDEWKNMKDNLYKFEKVHTDSIVRVPMIEQEHIVDAQFASAQKQMIDLLPVSFISPLINKDDHTIEFGYAITLDNLKRLNGVMYDEYNIINQQECFKTMVKTVGADRLTIDSIGFIFDYLKDNNLELKSDIWGYTLGSFMDENNIDVRVHILYFCC